jgi:hypothetical protein
LEYFIPFPIPVLVGCRGNPPKSALQKAYMIIGGFGCYKAESSPMPTKMILDFVIYLQEASEN